MHRGETSFFRSEAQSVIFLMCERYGELKGLFVTLELFRVIRRKKITGFILFTSMKSLLSSLGLSLVFSLTIIMIENSRSKLLVLKILSHYVWAFEFKKKMNESSI